jgi:hypothetical protein
MPAPRASHRNTISEWLRAIAIDASYSVYAFIDGASKDGAG